MPEVTDLEAVHCDRSLEHDSSMSVFITPELSAITSIPSGNSFATDLVRPSTAHFDAQ